MKRTFFISMFVAMAVSAMAQMNVRWGSADVRYPM